MRKGDTDVSNRPKCSNFAPATFGGHWRDWHRGHGCNLDPTPQSQPVVSPPPTPDVERLTWQPIATAPKDGTTVLLWWESEIGNAVVEFYGCGRWREFGDGSKGWSGESIHASEKGYWTRLIGEQPTHWMPLPDPPVVGDTPTPGGEQP